MAHSIQKQIFTKRAFGFAPLHTIPFTIGLLLKSVLTPTMLLVFIRLNFSRTRLVFLDTLIQFQEGLLRFESQKWLVQAI